MARCIAYALEDIVPVWGDFVTWVECFDLNMFADRVEGLLNEEYPSMRANLVEFVISLVWKAIFDLELQRIEESVEAPSSEGAIPLGKERSY